jgi:hypothetical protein
MLKYIGDGSSMPGIPARDLTDDEIYKIGRAFCLTTGLYVDEPPTGKEEKDEVKHARDQRPAKNTARA